MGWPSQQLAIDSQIYYRHGMGEAKINRALSCQIAKKDTWQLLTIVEA